MSDTSLLAILIHLIETYGYLFVFVGTLVEGETVLLAAGYAAHQGLLDWWTVVAVAACGGTLGDQAAFLVGRWKGAAIIKRSPALTRHAPRVHRLLERFNVLLILVVRFLYGLRIAGPVIMGSSRIPMLRFALLNLVAAAAWAMLVAGAGYTFGAATEAMFSHVKHVERIALLVVLGLGFLFWLRHVLRDRAGRKK
jgi:membrane protein DedA with SNARE-associated domain